MEYKNVNLNIVTFYTTEKYHYHSQGKEAEG
jgi:hypothetical protein